MDFIHVRNLEKYHPGYKDRILLWAKIHIKMIQGDPDCEMITDETDWARLVKFILLELNAQKPIPLDPVYLHRKGFNLKKRPISLTIKMLHSFIDIVSNTDTECIQDVTQNRVDKNRIDIYSALFEELWFKYPNKLGKKNALRHFNASVKADKDIKDIKKALDNYLAHLQANTWKKPQNASTWFNNWHDWIKIEDQVSELDKTIEEERKKENGKN